MLERLETRTTYQQPKFKQPAFKPEPGSPAANAAALARQERKDNLIFATKAVGVRAGASALTLALLTGGGVALSELGKSDPGKQNKTTQVIPNPESNASDSKLELTPEQRSRADEAARGTALAHMQEAKGSGPDTRNGYGQLVFMKADPQNARGEAVWARAYNTVDGLHINFERAAFSSPDGTIEKQTNIDLSQTLDFINPSTKVFTDGVLTSEEAALVFKDPNTVLTNGTRELDGSTKEAAEIAIGKDGTVVAGEGEEFTVTLGKSGLDPLPSVQDEKRIQELLEWVMSK